jgi:hypothetical protein
MLPTFNDGSSVGNNRASQNLSFLQMRHLFRQTIHHNCFCSRLLILYKPSKIRTDLNSSLQQETH